MALTSRTERVAQGRALRNDIPRSSHAAWPALSNRPQAVDLLEQSHDSRLPELEAVRWGRMLVSPFTFLRGSAMVMAWDLAHRPHGELYVQACGDAHLGNFGFFATPERRMIFDLRDFDETLPAPWEWDVKRLAASIVVAGRERGLSRARLDEAVRLCLRSYRETMRASVALTHLEIWYRRVDADELTESSSRRAARFAVRSLKRARRRTSQRELQKLTLLVDGERHIKEEPPLVTPLCDRKTRDVVAGLFDEYAATLTPDRRLLFDRYHLVDLSYRVVGVGSVGTRCMIALFCGDDDDDPLFLQMKEASRSVLEPFVARPCSYANQGERVVQGQRIIQAASDIFLGWKRSGGFDYYVRQLKDMKGNVDVADLHPTVLVRFAGLCGRTLAQAHARSGDFCQIAGYLGRSDSFDVAVAEFAHAYADQVERDHQALQVAVRGGRLPAELGMH
jgi:uncharacterized protein (DUF2252 family)